MIAFPVLVLLIFGIIEMGAAWRTFQVVTNSAREGARLAVLPSSNDADVYTAIGNRLTQGGLDPSTATSEIRDASGTAATKSDFSTGDSLEVRIVYPFDFVFLGPIVNYISGNGSAWGTVNMETGFVMRIE
jgi:hypothetical protein